MNIKQDNLKIVGGVKKSVNVLNNTKDKAIV